MSGIAGIFNPKGLRENSREKLTGMLATLQHRGPDGTFIRRNRDGTLALGQTYLEINGSVDRNSPGSGPIFARDNEHKIMCANGRFYEFRKTRAELQLEGVEFHSKNDHEIVLPLYERDGLDFINQLRGEFAISLWDDRRKRLFLIRDRFGVKPLFYHIKDNTIYWASEIKGLFAHPDIEAKFSTQGLLHQLMHTMVPGTSAFKDILAVKPGHVLIVDYASGQLEVTEKEYWDLDYPDEGSHDLDTPPEVRIQQVRDALLEAVAVRMEADHPVSAYVSGGIDSCSILGMASALQQHPVKAYTISFDNSDYDESHIAREMASSVDADHEQIVLTADELYGENYVNTLWHAERTFYNTLGVAKNRMSHKVRETGYRIALTGEGSDEIFSGYPSLKRDMLRYVVSQGAADSVEAASHQKLMDETNKLFTGAILSEEIVSHPAMDAVCGFTPSWIQPWLLTLDLARPLLHDDILAELTDYDPVAAIAESFNKERLENKHVLDKAQYTWSKTMVECQILNWGGDRVDMANAMESRAPFMDHKVVELAAQIPPHMRINGNTEKWILREAMKNVLPETLYKREKHAFMAPPSHTDERKQAGLKALIARYMDAASVRDAGLFDPGRLKTFLDEYWADQDPVSLTRKDALVNHILGLHILWHLFVRK